MNNNRIPYQYNEDFLDERESSNPITHSSGINQSQEQQANNPESLTQNLRRQIEESGFCVYITLIIRFFKITSPIYVLLFTYTGCSPRLANWFGFVLLNEVYRLTLEFDKKKLNDDIKRFLEENMNFTRDLELGPMERLSRFNAFNQEVEKKRKDLNYKRNVCSILNFMLAFWGLVIYNNYSAQCATSNPAMNSIAYYIISISMLPLIAVLVCCCPCCLCLPCVAVILRRYSDRFGQRAAPKNAIKNLKVVKLDENFEGDRDCSICFAEYVPTDKILVLPCNKLHHFHEDCIKQWLNVNGICPMCRHRVT